VQIISKIERKYLMLALITALATSTIITSYKIYAQLFTSPVGATATDITVGKSLTSIAVNPTTNMIYVANRVSDSVSVINGTTGKVLSNNVVGKSPTAIAVNPTTNKVYVANSDSNSVSDKWND
jgi:YVTN family beta-propeller protein